MLAPESDRTRVHLRLRLAGLRRRRLTEYGGGLLDLLTVAGLAAGLRERVVTGTTPDDATDRDPTDTVAPGAVGNRAEPASSREER